MPTVPEKYLAKSVEVEALQFNRDTHRTVERWVQALNIRSWIDGVYNHAEYQLRGGKIHVKTGDYVVKFDGKFFVIPEALFDGLYRSEHGVKLLTTYDP